MSNNEVDTLAMMFLIFFSSGVGVFITINFVEHSVHKSMTNIWQQNYKVGTYRDFLSEFYKNPMYLNGYDEPSSKIKMLDGSFMDYKHLTFEGSLFDRESNSEYHASIIQFNGVRMFIKNPIDYYFVRRFMRKYFKKIEKDGMLQWNSN